MEGHRPNRRRTFRPRNPDLRPVMAFPSRFFEKAPLSYPLYLFLVLSVLILIVLVNGYIEIQRTRSQLFRVLETEGRIIIRGIETNSANLISSLEQARSYAPSSGISESTEDSLSIEDLLIERLVSLALRLDQEAAQRSVGKASKAPSETMDLRHIYFLSGGSSDPVRRQLPENLKKEPPFFQEVLIGKTRLAVLRGEGAWRESTPLAVAVARRFGPGIILISVSPDEYSFLTRQIIIQGFLEEFSGKGNIAYITVEGSNGQFIAQTAGQVSFRPGRENFKKEVGSKGQDLYWIGFKDQEVLEILRPFAPAGRSIGRIRLGLSLKEVNPILHQAGRNILLMSLVLIGLGILSLYFIFHLQGRHFRKMKEMEEQIRLKEELSAMGQLAAGVAHEIKNPLNAISLVVQRLQQEFHWPEPEAQQEYERFTRIVRDEISRVNQIIGQFLMVARPLASRLEEQSLTAILDYVLEVLAEELRLKKIRLSKTWSPDLPLIFCDRFQLTQAFLNIFNNALEAVPEGGEISVSVRPKEDNKIELIIRDSGRGIAPDDLKKIFAYYYTTKEKGVGLGLAITRKMIQAHGGDLEVRSVLAQGTTVIVGLPKRPRPGQKA